MRCSNENGHSCRSASTSQHTADVNPGKMHGISSDGGKEQYSFYNRSLHGMQMLPCAQPSSGSASSCPALRWCQALCRAGRAALPGCGQGRALKTVWVSREPAAAAISVCNLGMAEMKGKTSLDLVLQSSSQTGAGVTGAWGCCWLCVSSNILAERSLPQRSTIFLALWLNQLLITKYCQVRV